MVPIHHDSLRASSSIMRYLPGLFSCVSGIFLSLALQPVVASESKNERAGFIVCGFYEVFVMNPADSHVKGVVKKTLELAREGSSRATRSDAWKFWHYG